MSNILTIRSLPTPTATLLTPLVTVAIYGVYKAGIFIWEEYAFNPLNILPGPSNPSWIFGNMKQIWEVDNPVTYEKWVKQFGKTFKYKTFLGMSQLYTTDLKALNHVLMDSQTYYKPGVVRFFLSKLLGNGLLVVEGPQHRQQRRVMNPAFGAAQIRELTEIFVEKSLELRDIWDSEIKQQCQEGESGLRVNVIAGLSKMTLDAIGLAGFNYKFDALSGKKNELNDAFHAIFNTNPRMTLIMVVRDLLGKLGKLIPEAGDGQVLRARATMDRIGKQLLEESKLGLLEDEAKQVDEKFRRRDLLSLLLKANVNKEVPQSQRMNDADAIAQVATFLVAGHETTSNAITWALHALCLNKTVQSKLREELYTLATENPTMDELNALPYLDAVVREALRLHPPLHSSIKVAMKDDIIPVETPYLDKNGRVRDSIFIHKGQTVLIPILAINRSEEHWGSDAAEFKPERWESIPAEASKISGVWGNMLTFLGGPRGCIGFRFALVEMKALLFTLVRAFEFDLAVPVNEIGKIGDFVQRPILLSEPKEGIQMPMLVRSHVHIN